jgi:hypothetical protein
MNARTEHSMYMMDTLEILFIHFQCAIVTGPSQPRQEKSKQKEFLQSCHESLGDSASEDGPERERPQRQGRGKRQVKITEKAK